MRFKPVSDSKTSIYQFALSLDKLINPRFWGTLPVSQATALAHNFFWLSCCLHGVLGVGFGEEFLELSLYHTASLCRYLPGGQSFKVSECVTDCHLQPQRPAMINAEVWLNDTKSRVQVRALAVKCRLANAISGKSNAVYEVVTCVTELTRLLLAVFERFRS